MSWHCSQGGAEAFSLPGYLDSIRSARSRLSRVHGRCCLPDSEMVSCPPSRSGMTCGALTEGRGEEWSMLSAAGSRARISALPARERGLRASEAGCGERCSVSFARFDRVSCSWRIHPCLFPEDSPLFLGTWPAQGMMRAGVCSELMMLALPTSARDCGCLHMIPTPTACNAPNKGGNTKGPKGLMEVARTDWMPGERWRTPQATDWKHTGYSEEALARRRAKGRQLSLAEQVRELYPTPTCQDAKNNGGAAQQRRNTRPLNAVCGGALNPPWVEWLMGWPIGWTALEPLGTDRFRWWLRSHLRFLENV